MLSHRWAKVGPEVVFSVGLSLSACGNASHLSGFAAAAQDGATGDLADAAVSRDGWTSFDPGCGYTLLAPPNVSQIPARGTDSCVSEFASSPCSFEGDYGVFSAGDTKDASKAEYQVHTVQIGDRKGVQLVTYETTSGQPLFAARVFFPAVASHGPALSLLAQCQTADGRQIALAMFQTIQFE